MGSENQSFEEPEPTAEQMQNLVLHDEDNDDDDPLSSKSYSNYRSAMSTLSETHHPLAADSDPLLSPPPSHHHLPNPDTSSYIDPPSYNDAVFSPFNGASAADDNSPAGSTYGSSVSRSPSSTSEHIKITVSNPVKEQENSNSIVPGGNSYVTYLITTRTNVPEFGGTEFSVRRRFRDVVTLSDRLAESYRGFFIPPRPDKSIVESQVVKLVSS